MKMIKYAVLGLLITGSGVSVAEETNYFSLDGLSFVQLSTDINEDVHIPLAKAEPVISRLGYHPRKACEKVTFSDYDGPYIRRDVTIYTGFTERVCDEYGCYNQETWASAMAELTINSRQLPAGQVEKLELCYDFVKNEGSFVIKESPFRYSARTQKINGRNAFFVELTPVRSVPQP